MKSDNSKYYNKEYNFLSGYSILHLFVGFISFIVTNKYLKCSPLTVGVILFITHTIYECKDYYVTYVLYENNHEKIDSARKYLKNKYKDKCSIIGIETNPELHMPPNGFINSLGDTAAFIIGMYIATQSKTYISGSISNLFVLISVYYWIIFIMSFICTINMDLFDKKYVSDNL